VGAWFDALYRFSRPHTMLGTAVSVCSVSALALGPGQLGAGAAWALAQALSSALLMNICIVGINQVRNCPTGKEAVGLWCSGLPCLMRATTPAV
jgi:homogentisate phytyltransferase/homogentisate geranylgeranyltransferase